MIAPIIPFPDWTDAGLDAYDALLSKAECDFIALLDNSSAVAVDFKTGRVIFSRLGSEYRATVFSALDGLPNYHEAAASWAGIFRKDASLLPTNGEEILAIA